jgi:hypothetical protein
MAVGPSAWRIEGSELRIRDQVNQRVDPCGAMNFHEMGVQRWVS